MQEFVGKKVKVVYTDDGRDKAVVGWMKTVKDGYATLDDEYGDTIYSISVKRIVHVAVLNNEG